MARIAIDVGNYDTTVTLGPHDRDVGKLLQGVAREIQPAPLTWSVPTVIHLGDPVLLGEEVLRAGVYNDEATFRDLKDHILHPADVLRVAGGRRVTHKEAALAFLRHVLQRLRADLAEELDVVLVFSNAEGHSCRDWLRANDLPAARSILLVDEDTALALGCQVDLFADDLNLVFDFGFSSIRARVVQFNWLGQEAYLPPAVRASAEVPFGMADLRLGVDDRLQSDPCATKASFRGRHPSILHDASPEWLNDETFREEVATGVPLKPAQQALLRVLEEARSAGVAEREICKVLLLGGGFAVPAVRRFFEARFGDRVAGDSSRLATGRGALTFLCGHPQDDRVRDTYAVRMRDPVTGEYLYPVVVEKYTRYPTRNPTARYVVNTYYDGQKALNLHVYKIARCEEKSSPAEILFREDGKIGFVGIGAKEVHEAAMDTPLIIPVQPPGRSGERRFHLEFNVDHQKHLVVSVKDLREDKTVWEERPLLRLA